MVMIELRWDRTVQQQGLSQHAVGCSFQVRRRFGTALCHAKRREVYEFERRRPCGRLTRLIPLGSARRLPSALEAPQAAAALTTGRLCCLGANCKQRQPT